MSGEFFDDRSLLAPLDVAACCGNGQRVERRMILAASSKPTAPASLAIFLSPIRSPESGRGHISPSGTVYGGYAEYGRSRRSWRDAPPDGRETTALAYEQVGPSTYTPSILSLGGPERRDSVRFTFGQPEDLGPSDRT